MPGSFCFYDTIATGLPCPSCGYSILGFGCQQAELKFTKAQLAQAEMLTVMFFAEQRR